MNKLKTLTRKIHLFLLLLFLAGTAAGGWQSLQAEEYNLDKNFKFRELGNDVWLTVGKNLSARVGFREFGTESPDDSNNTMRSFSPFSALVNWHLFEGGFYLSMGAVQAEDPEKKQLSTLDSPHSMTLFSWDAQNEASSEPLNFDIKKNEPYLGLGFGNYLDKTLDSFFFIDIGILHNSELSSRNSGNLTGTENRSFFEKLESISLSENENGNASRYEPLFKMGLSLKY